MIAMLARLAASREPARARMGPKRMSLLRQPPTKPPVYLAFSEISVSQGSQQRAKSNGVRAAQRQLPRRAR